MVVFGCHSHYFHNSPSYSGSHLLMLLQFLTSLLGFATAIIILVYAILGRRKMGEIHDEVKTSNDLSIGALEAAGESRRIAAKPRNLRTLAEQLHLQQQPTPPVEED
jgi:hypothetical protein